MPYKRLREFVEKSEDIVINFEWALLEDDWVVKSLYYYLTEDAIERIRQRELRDLIMQKGGTTCTRVLKDEILNPA